MARDKLWNGVVLGAIVGILIAGSSWEWLSSIVTKVIEILPTGWQTMSYIKEIVFGIAGALVGLVIDKY